MCNVSVKKGTWMLEDMNIVFTHLFWLWFDFDGQF